jgi:hypothetical protein
MRTGDGAHPDGPYGHSVTKIAYLALFYFLGLPLGPGAAVRL